MTEYTDYDIIKSKTIVDNFDAIVIECDKINDKIRHDLNLQPEESTTWAYENYGIFKIAKEMDMPLFNSLYDELYDQITRYTDGRTCWVQAWLNHEPHDKIEGVLGEHNHLWPVQGFIAIDPKETETVFTEHGYTVNNEIGNMYIGPGHRMHKILNTAKYDGTRTTIGWDLSFDHPLYGGVRYMKMN